MPLSDATFRNAKPREKPYRLSDGDGLYLLIQPNGSKLWQMRYRRDGKENVLSFGKYPAVTLAKARAKRDAARAAQADGHDPGKLAPSRSGALIPPERLFRNVAEAWFERTRVNKGWTPTHAFTVWSAVRRDALPNLGLMDVGEITPLDVIAALRPMEARGAVDSMHRLRANLARIFDYAEAAGLVTGNPASARIAHHLAAQPAVTHMKRLRAEQLPQFFADPRDWPGPEQHRLAVELNLHTFTRTTELRLARWAEIKGDLWHIPPERMKARRPHIVPLSRESKAILARLKGIAGESPHLFPSPLTRDGIAPVAFLSRPLKAMGYAATPHGSRGLFDTVINEIKQREGFDRDAIERQLAHKVGNSVEAAYNHAEYMDERVRIMDWYSGFLARAKAESEGLASRRPTPPGD